MGENPLFPRDYLLSHPERYPKRLLELTREFEAIVKNQTFPCIFSNLPFTTGEIHFELLHDSDAFAKEVVLALKRLCATIREAPDAMGVIFVEQPVTQSMSEDLKLARRVVQAVMRANEEDRPDASYPHPTDPEWMLWLDDIGLFINFSSPAHRSRRSRNVGSAFTIIAQARESFDRQGRASVKARAEIRRRLSAYDSVPPHPSLSAYGAPENREIHQFFLGDGLQAQDLAKACPHES